MHLMSVGRPKARPVSLDPPAGRLAAPPNHVRVAGALLAKSARAQDPLIWRARSEAAQGDKTGDRLDDIWLGKKGRVARIEDFEVMQVTAACAHRLHSLPRQNVGISPPNDHERHAREGIELRPQ